MEPDSDRENTAFVGMGANLGNREKTCRRAIEMISGWNGCKLLKTSSFYETEPWGLEDQNSFINCVIQVETAKDALAFLNRMKQAEGQLGREQRLKWGPRTIDLDLLFFNDDIINEPGLVVPHPLLHQRRFVLEPLAEIAPHLVHPVLGRPLALLLAEVADDKKVIKVDVK